MKYAVILIVSLISFFICAEYRAYMKKRLLECAGFVEFIAHAKIQVGCYLKPQRELLTGFSSVALESAGFRGMKDGETLSDLFMRCDDRLSLSEEERAVLLSLFSSFGKGYLEDQLSLIDESERRMKELYQRLCEVERKNARLVPTLFFCGSAALIIFII